MSNPLPMLNGDKTAVGDFSTDPSVNMVAAIRDHISCTKPVQVDNFVTEDTKAGIIYPCDFDHMYASLTEGTVVQRENLEVKHLKDLLLLHLDLIQQQSEQLVTKDKQISSLRQENETLRQRLERMDRRVNLHKQRDGLMPPVDNIAERSPPVPSFESTFVVPKLEPNVLPSSPESVVSAPVPAVRQHFYRPGTPFPGRIEYREEPRYSPPLQHREVVATRENGVPSANATLAVAPPAACEAEEEPPKRRRTDEGEPSPRVPSPTGHPSSLGGERVSDTALDSDGATPHRDSSETSHTDDCQRMGRGTAAWVSCAGRRRRRLHFRHGRSNESESSAVSQPHSPTRSGSGDSRHPSRGRGRRALRVQHRGRTAGGRRRRRSGDAFKDVLSTDRAYWTTIGELSSALRLHEGLGTDCTTVEVPSWRHKVYTSCYAMEGTENLDDEVFSKRHQRYESDERRRKRWDVQRIREQRHVEKLRQQEAARAVSAPIGRASGGHRRSDDNPLASLWPSPEDVTYVEIGEKLPVAAFGAPVINFHPNEFSLPWKWRPGVPEKMLRRRHHGPYTNRDGVPHQGREGGGGGGTKR
ncbi:male-specific lethal 1 homolog isoform X1 [Schistocerca gregaria]|uniref:male-specific lethal 1 homolog isoform X1 n=2 Tax=Schistocerca gregaria TaxID=7010 RepID=UPI00211EF87F|nr:male-specific lethal 1 homolog isoform X1 [Schistocerca gregaria]